MSFLRGALPKRTVDSDVPQFPCGIKLWNDSADAVIDIVFVHGLTGDRDRTWTHPLDSEPWPKIMLPQYVSKARLLTFGYDAYVLRKGAAVSNQLMDHSRDFLNSITSLRQRTGSVGRPLILVGHSLGGLVCKDAILQSKTSLETHLQDVSQSIAAIAFLGTPHGGSDVASWAKIPAKALGIVKPTNTDLLSVLQTNSEVLARIQNDFLFWLRELDKHGQSLNVTCFWESLPMPHIGYIVEKTSASLPGYNAMSIHADHRDMVRFHHKGDPGLLSLVGELSRWVDEITNIPSVGIENSASVANKLREQQRAECLKSLLFAGMDSRRQNIERPNPKTCEWISEHSCYKAWDHQNKPDSPDFLWIKGKPGSGKSTMMKSMIMRHDKPGVDCLSFYFNARGAQIENSPQGLYRSLLFQLLQKCKSAMNAFLPQYLEREQEAIGGRVIWQTPEVSDFFHTAISTMLSTPTYLFIDALDECDEDEVRKVVRRLEDCLIKASSSANRASLKICVSSRHFPNITLRTVDGQQIFMENHNQEDIKRFVYQELSFEEVKLRRELTLGILEKSAGVFIWTSLVVRRLLKASDQGYSPEQMNTILKSVPPGLEELLSEMVSILEERLTDLPLLAAWVVCAMRPLSAFELFTALCFTGENPPRSLKDSRIQKAHFDHKRFSRYLLDASGGLFEIAPSGRIQVIHDSVREFFLESQAASKLLKLRIGKTFRQHSHETISAACSNYFSTKEVRQFIPSSPTHPYASASRLITMLYRPIPIQFDVFALLGRTYFYEFVFQHLKWLSQESSRNSIDVLAPAIRSPRFLFEGWLVILYHLTLQTGYLSSNQRDTMDILFKEPSLINMKDAEMIRISRAINLLVVFVNKTMKDGFTLTTPSIFVDYIKHEEWPHDISPCSSEYLRTFWQYPTMDTFLSNIGPTPTRFHSDGYKRKFDRVTKEINLYSLVRNQSLESSFGFGYRIQVPQSRSLGDLQWSWLHGFPSFTLPLEDWQIFESIISIEDAFGGVRFTPEFIRPNTSQLLRSMSPSATDLQSTSHQWKSVTLKTLDPPSFSQSTRLFDIEEQDMAPMVCDDGRRLFQVMANRNDSEFRSYNLHIVPERTPKT